MNNIQISEEVIDRIVEKISERVSERLSERIGNVFDRIDDAMITAGTIGLVVSLTILLLPNMNISFMWKREVKK